MLTAFIQLHYYSLQFQLSTSAFIEKRKVNYSGFNSLGNMRDVVYVVKGCFREQNKRSFRSGESQMINTIKYILAFQKYFVMLNAWNAEVQNPHMTKTQMQMH